MDGNGNLKVCYIATRIVEVNYLYVLRKCNFTWSFDRGRLDECSGGCTYKIVCAAAMRPFSELRWALLLLLLLLFSSPPAQSL